MSYGLSTDPFLLKEGNVYVGSFSSYPTSSTANPKDAFTGDILGYFKQGTINLSMPRAYAEARAGTPSKLLRKDLIQKDLMLEFDNFQFNNDILRLIMGTDFVQNSIESLDLHYLGTDEVQQDTNGFMIETALTDGTPLNIFIWEGKVTSEDMAIALSGTEHAIIAAKIEAFVPSTSPPGDTKNLGVIVFDRS